MKIQKILMMAAVATVMSSSAMANGRIIGTTPSTVKAPPVVVYTDSNGNISKQDFMAYESRRYDEAMAMNRNGKVLDDRGRAVSRGRFMAQESRRFDEMDASRAGIISRDQFDALDVSMVQPAAGGPGVSTSRPRAYNQAIPTSGVPGGADGAGGWTAQ